MTETMRLRIELETVRTRLHLAELKRAYLLHQVRALAFSRDQAIDDLHALALDCPRPRWRDRLRAWVNNFLAACAAGY